MCISTAHRCPVGACAPTGMHLASCSLLGVAAAVFVAPAAAGRVVSCSPQIDSCTAVDLGRARIELPSRAVTPRRPRRHVRGAPGTGESLVRTHYCAGSPMGCGAECSLTVCAWYMYAQRVVCTARNECRLHLQLEWRGGSSAVCMGGVIVSAEWGVRGGAPLTVERQREPLMAEGGLVCRRVPCARDDPPPLWWGLPPLLLLCYSAMLLSYRTSDTHHSRGSPAGAPAPAPCHRELCGGATW